MGWYAGVLAVLCIWLYSETQAATCHIEVQAYNAPEETFFEQGFINVNGIRAISLQNEKDTLLGKFGLWMVATTPACEILDVTFFSFDVFNHPNVAPLTSQTASTDMDPLVMDAYLESWPRETIFIGASVRDVQKIFNIDECTADLGDTFHQNLCMTRRVRMFLTALGLQEKFSDPTVSDNIQTGGFVVQKGSPHKAQWLYQDQNFSPVTFQAEISTPDALLCPPLMPILPWDKDAVAVGDVAISLQPFRCEGFITTWRFYALTAGQVVFDVWRQSTATDWSVVSSTTIEEMTAGENFHCLEVPVQVHVGDHVGIRYPQGYAGDPVIPLARKEVIPKDKMPNCPQASELKLTEADMVPIHLYTKADFDPAVDTVTNERFTAVHVDISIDQQATYVKGLMMFHPYMTSDWRYQCACADTSECLSWDQYATCDGTCTCRDGFTFDHNTLSCVEADASVGKSVYSSGVEDNNDLNNVVDENENTDASGTCATIAAADRPWVVIDLGERMKVTGVTLKIPEDAQYARIVDETIPITDVIPRDPNDKYTALFKHDISGFGFYHPPCVAITAAADGMYIVVRDVSQNTVWFTAQSDSDFTGAAGNIDIEMWETPLFNFRIGVSDSGSPSCFDPAQFDTCVDYVGNVMRGETLHVPCDNVHMGRYVMLYVPGDGFTGQDTDWQFEPDRQSRSFSLCDIDVHALKELYCGFSCQTDRDCQVARDDDNVQCVDWDCVCKDGFLRDDTTCTCLDINECDTDNGGCSHVCTNLPGSFLCECPDYYKLDTDNLTCVDIDECAAGTAGVVDAPPCQQLCDNAVFPYECGCNAGYTLAEDKHTCLDVNECEQVDPPCDATNGGCTNTLASYTCYCNDGWKLDTDGSTCINVNECEVNNGGCEHDCVDEEGAYSCTCKTGFKLLEDKRGCEQDVENQCLATPCDATNGVCVYKAGLYTCDCADGWMLEAADSTTCIDADECTDGSALCAYGCENSPPGSFTCSCPDGLTLSGNGFSCLDVDECETADVCPQTCVNTYGNYRCVCNPGFVEAADGECVGADGCSEGYMFDAGAANCVDKDECSDGSSGCEQGCQNTVGGYTCSCRDGYTLKDGKFCEDNDECAAGDTECAFICVNVQGSYECSCGALKYVAENGKDCVGPFMFLVTITYDTPSMPVYSSHRHEDTVQKKLQTRDDILSEWNPEGMSNFHVLELSNSGSLAVTYGFDLVPDDTMAQNVNLLAAQPLGRANVLGVPEVTFTNQGEGPASAKFNIMDPCSSYIVFQKCSDCVVEQGEAACQGDKDELALIIALSVLGSLLALLLLALCVGCCVRRRDRGQKEYQREIIENPWTMYPKTSNVTAYSPYSREWTAPTEYM